MTLIQTLCSSYTVVPANKTPAVLDQTGGHFIRRAIRSRHDHACYARLGGDPVSIRRRTEPGMREADRLGLWLV